jgi:hypothetical protein
MNLNLNGGGVIPTTNNANNNQHQHAQSTQATGLSTFSSTHSLSSLPSLASMNSLSSLNGVPSSGGMSSRMLGGLLDEMGASATSGPQQPHPLAQGINMNTLMGLHQQGHGNQLAAQGHLQHHQMQDQQQTQQGAHPQQHQQNAANNQMQPNKDDIIPTAIVIKNIPFAVQKETLLAVIVSVDPWAFPVLDEYCKSKGY